MIFYSMFFFFFFFFNDTATTEIYTLSLHDALPICRLTYRALSNRKVFPPPTKIASASATAFTGSAKVCSRSEEHTSELQSLRHLVCRLLLEKKKKKKKKQE